MVGPKTNEIILDLNRVGLQGFDFPEDTEVKLKIYKFACPMPPTDEDKITEISSFGVAEDGIHHFELSGVFLSDIDNFPKGFYRAEVIVADCTVDYIDIVKAASVYVATGEAVADKCVGDTEYVEPSCDGNEPEETTPTVTPGCECWEQGLDGCPNCLSERKKVAKVCVDEAYLPPDPFYPAS